MAENRELALVLKLVADQFQSELRKSGGALGEFNRFVSDWKTQLTAAGAALFAIAKSTANYGDELVKASQRMGTSIADTARLQHAARLSDTDLQGLSSTVGFLSKQMLAASSGNREAQQTFDRLGISVVSSNGQLKGTTQILLEMNDKFRLMPEGPEKTALAMLTLGKTGKEVLPLLNSNLREAFEESDRLGLTMSGKAAKAAEHFNDELTKLQAAVRGVTNDVGTLLIPKFDAIAHALTTIITDARAAAQALTGLDKIDAPTVGVVKPNGGGRNLRILPIPEGMDKAATGAPFFRTPEQAADENIKKLAELKKLGDEQERLGKAKVDIFVSQHRALETSVRLQQEALAKEQERMDLSDELDAEVQEEAGRRIVERTAFEVRVREEGFARERDALIQNAQAWIAYHDQVGGSTALRYEKDVALTQATLAKQLELTQEEAGQLLEAWQTHESEKADLILSKTALTAQQRETIELQSLTKLAQAEERASDDVFAGWARGMQRYVRDTQSGFGLGADMARRTAQAMEQGFRNFFFDVMDNKIKSFKDLLQSLLGFVKQIVAQITAQLVTAQIIKFATAAFSGPVASGNSASGASMFAAQGGEVVRRFASGGPVLGIGTSDTVPALLTPGEFVLSRRDVQDIKRGAAGGNTIVTNISVQAGGERRESGSGESPNFAQLARDLSKLVESKIIDEQRPGGLLFGGTT